MAGKRIAVFSLLALAGLALALFASSGTHAQTYKPTFGYTVADNTHDFASTTTNVIDIPKPDYNYEDSSLYTFTPIDGSSTTGTAIAIADEMGTLDSSVYVGLLGGPCSVNLPPLFHLENASVSSTPELSSAEMYWVLKPFDVYDVPKRDKCENDIDDDADTKVNDGCPAIGPAETAGECDNAIDDDDDSFSLEYQNGVNDGCPAVATGELLTDPLIPDYLEAMPHFINELLDPDGRHGPDPPLTPDARYAGYTTVAGMNIIIQFIVLEPGQIMELGGIKAQMGPELGQPSLIVLDNPISQEEAPGAISDFCTPLSTTTILLGQTLANQYTATGGGTVARNNPPEDTGVLGTGTHMSRNYSQSERDADGDGHENDLDPCHYTDDTGWDPTQADLTPPTCNVGDIPGDDDCDGLPNSCDPKFTGIGTCADSNPLTKDCDADGYNNRQDICPLVPSGCNTAACFLGYPKIWAPAWENMGDDEGAEPNADVGPGPDSIGNACDDSNDDGMENGTGPNPGSGDCNDGVDNDADTLIDGNDPECVPFMDAAGVGKCRDAIDRDGDTKVNDGCPQKGAAPESACDDNLDDDGDTRVNDGCPAVGDPEDPGVTDLSTVWGANPGTGQFYHAMPWTAVTINAATDTDGDGYSDALECYLCANDVDDDPTDDGGSPGDYINDGCPALDAAETDCGPDEALPLDDDSDGAVNDGCPAVNRSECGSNPGSSSSVPESLVIDAWVAVGAGAPPKSGGFPPGPAAQSCSDGVDNDGDTKTDVNDNDDLGCNPDDDSYTGDADRDGVDDASDNCGTSTSCAVWNPEQHDVDTDSVGDACDGDIVDLVTDSDSDTIVDRCDNCPNDNSSTDQTDLDWDHQGDICDLDDDGDGFTDVVEDYLPTDDRDRCPDSPGGNDAWPLDINIDKFVTVGGDVLPYRGNIGAAVTNPTLQRLDLNKDSFITVGGDVLPFRGNIGKGCT